MNCGAHALVRFVILKPYCDAGIIREMRDYAQKQRTTKKAHAALLKAACALKGAVTSLSEIVYVRGVHRLGERRHKFACVLIVLHVARGGS